MKLVKIVGGMTAVLLAGLAILFVVARFHDGPIAMIPGGPFTSGKMTHYRIIQWQQFINPKTIELQLAGEDTSRTTWVVVRKSRAYIPASLGFPPFKTWHLRAKKNGRAIIRMGGKLFDVRLDLVSDPELEEALAEGVKKKYGSGPPGDAEVWYFWLRSMAPLPGQTQWHPLVGF